MTELIQCSLPLPSAFFFSSEPVDVLVSKHFILDMFKHREETEKYNKNFVNLFFTRQARFPRVSSMVSLLMVRMKVAALAPVITLCSFLFLYSWFGACALYLGHLILTVGATAPVQGLAKILSLAPSCTVQIEVISVGAHERGTSSYLLACMCAKSLQYVQFFMTPWTVAHQTPLFTGFSRVEC